MPTPAPRRPIFLLALVMGAALFFTALWMQMGSGRLWHHDEILTAERAREMVVSGDPWAVRLNGRPNFQKPPVQYWLTAGLLRLFPGQPERAVRLPSAVAATLCLLATAALGRVAWPDDPWAGPGAALALAGCGFWVHFARMGMLDAGAALGVAVTLLGTEIVRQRGDARGWWLAGAGAAFGAWQKAPYALGAWVLTLLGRVRTGELLAAPARWPRALRWSLLATVALVLAWPAWQLARFGGAAVLRGQSDSTGNLFNANKSAGFQPWLYYFWLVRDWAAFGLLVPVAVGAALGRGGRGDPFRREAAVTLLLGWGVVACLPYRTERYLVFLLPVAALLVVRFLRRDDGAGRPRRHGGMLLAAALVSTLPVAGFHYLKTFPDRGSLHAASVSFGAACAADPAAVPVVDRALASGINVPFFAMFYGNLDRPARVFYDWSEQAMVRVVQRAPGERAVGISRPAVARAFAPTREISRHGSAGDEWVVWTSGP